MALDASQLTTLAQTSVERPKAGASFTDVLLGLVSEAGSAAINRRFAERNPDVTDPAQINQDTAGGEIKSGREPLIGPTGIAIGMGGAALLIVLVVLALRK